MVVSGPGRAAISSRSRSAACRQTGSASTAVTASATSVGVATGDPPDEAVPQVSELSLAVDLEERSPDRCQPGVGAGGECLEAELLDPRDHPWAAGERDVMAIGHGRPGERNEWLEVTAASRKGEENARGAAPSTGITKHDQAGAGPFARPALEVQ